ncbi:glyceraldehyde-3-phosphate dehydrogenase [Sulfodiicoccus acidiphilus]|uniref:Glyceraldehyde-3-phosphate dehydrogenase n=1 Tax=Sulfodiicoccus acidiphilus TaxID=1670455 RepID=A0A348B356_9CREN|nr:phosphorylating glyceraldehyde-3-phosphate dehydrogenase [Sulfodiicoccus acidiphilus]BBD72608.1 glyceraldehyde-3-phosphate dehydrogenase [Sulfodiicoccus acidiphilus]GGT93362.1 glyceraldehyde-3-phosphate dehydrogenase [Sulfodiicoccus acidiphilus]
MIKVAVNGYGTIGKRVADAVSKQPDMKLIGVTKMTPNFEAVQAIKKGIRLYTSKENMKVFEGVGIKVEGDVESLLEEADVIVDATPNGVGAKYRQTYQKLGKKAVFQGGEKADVAQLSFSALCNFEEALGKDSLRVVSCNTTGILRVLCTTMKTGKIAKVRGVIVRRAADLKEVKKGPINALVADPASIPSHHTLDVKSVLRDLDIMTAAVVAPTNLMHLHTLYVTMAERPSKDRLEEVLVRTPRIVLSKSVTSTAELFEAARDAGRERADIPEVVIFQDSINVKDNEVTFMYAVHQESIVVPENVDAIRALMGIRNSMELTNETLGVLKGVFP